MFTGIITDIGTVTRIQGKQVVRMEIATAYDVARIALGASVAHDGICLTVVEKGADWYAVELSSTTLSVTTAKDWHVGTKINLEQALKLGDELGGHMVSGHVDAVVEVLARRDEATVSHFTVALPEALAPFIAAKGSVVLNGVSLTVTEVAEKSFGLTLIPHTLCVTNWGEIRVGSRLNLEVDMIARYLHRFMHTGNKG